MKWAENRTAAAVGAVALGVLMLGPKWVGYYLAPTDCGHMEIEDL